MKNQMADGVRMELLLHVVGNPAILHSLESQGKTIDWDAVLKLIVDQPLVIRLR